MQTEVLVGIIVAYLLVYSYLFTPNTEFICVFLLIVMHLSTLIAMATDKNIDKSTTLSSIVDKRFLGDAAADVPLRVICMLALALQLVASIVLGNIYGKLCYYQSASGATNGHTLVDLETDQNRIDKRTVFQLMIVETCVILVLIVLTSPMVEVKRWVENHSKVEVKSWVENHSNVMILGILYAFAGASFCIYMANDLGVRLSNLYPDLAM